jgi:transcriptional regulator with XRE-family HTH domain
MSRLGYSIRTLREARGITSSRLARAAKISPTYLSLIEASERVPPAETLRKLADSLDIDVCVLEEFLPNRKPSKRQQLAQQLAAALKRVAQAQQDLKQMLG